MSVYELTEKQIDELKWKYFYGDEFIENEIPNANFPSEIPNEVIFNAYDGIEFVSDDFCSEGKEN